MSDLGARLEALTPEARERLARRVSVSATRPVALPRGDGVNTFRASFAQERLWVVEQMAPASAAANVAGAFRAVGPLDVARLRRAFERMVARHESLRTTVLAIDGRLMQVVSPSAVVSLSVRDADGVTLAAREAAACRAIDDEAERAFDVTRGPLLRVRVFRLADTMHLMAVTLHHLIADAWSVAIIVREVSALYRAERDDETVPPAPTLQYADFSVWQRRAFEADRLAASRAYWRARLRDVVAPPAGGGGRTRGGAVDSRDLAPGLVAGIRELGRTARTTLFVIALTVWHVVLARWLAKADVVVLSPVANREHPDCAAIVGFFVNVVALRARWGGNPRFRSLLAEAHGMVRDALRHQALPFEMVLEALGVERGADRPPLSPFAFALERAVDEPIVLSEVELQTVPLARPITRTDMALVVREHAHGIAVRVEHDRGRFDDATAEALRDGFMAVLEQAVTDPDRRVSVLHSGVEPRGVALVPTPRPSRSAGAAVTAWDHFAMQAARTPQAVALRTDGDVLTYERLLLRAERVAAVLQSQGVAAGALVAVWGERGVHLASALLGILRIGAVYLPIDPRWPAARVAQVLCDSRAGVVLTSSEVPGVLRTLQEESSGWRLVPIAAVSDDADGPRLAVGPVGPLDAAYVLYTSGSTGRPKGAVIEHAALLNHLRAKIALLGLEASDRVAQTAGAGFDISLWQYLAAWLVGGEVVVLDDATGRDPVRLRAAAARHRVTILEVVPAVLGLLLDADTAAGVRALGHLRWLVATGEVLPPALCRTWLERYPTVPVVNAYGPTECADDVAHHVVRTPPGPEVVRIPIGTPIDGVQVHVLDEALRPVARGEVGELCVTGVAVGRGYLHDPVRTASAFVEPDGMKGWPPTRLYRTGDVGRVLPNGTFECLGRRDRQIKIRGVRVEPEEVETVLQQHPGVREAAVVPRSGPNGTWRLVACVAAHATPVTLAEDLRRHVAAHLPDAMVPVAFELWTTLPLGGNGKIDRAALADVGTARSIESSPPRPAEPRSPCERRLTEIWREVLAVDVRSVDEDFFALGGDSLASIRVVAAARRDGFVITPQQIFEQRTIARIAAAAVALAVDPAEQGLIVGPVEPTPIQRMLLDADLQGLDHYNLSMLLEVAEPITPSWLALAVEHLMRHHDMLRMRWQCDSGEWRQTLAGLEGSVPFARVDLSSLPAAEVAPTLTRLAHEHQATLDLGAGPVWRVVLFDLGPSRPSRLLIIVHHLACDVVSWPILLEDLAAVYAQVGRGDAIALPAKTTSFQAWARSLETFADAPERSDELEFWQRECADPGSRLSGVDSGGAPRLADVERVSAVLGPRETAAIFALAAARATSIEAVLLTGLAIAVTEEAGGDAILVYLERHGREAIAPGCDVSRTVGWFTAVFPIRIEVAASRCPDASLGLVDAHVRGVPHGGVGYGALRYLGKHAARGGALLRALPRPELSFNYLGRLDPPEGAGWRFAAESPGHEVGVQGSRPTVLDVTAHVVGGRLYVAWDYDRARHARRCIERLGERMLEIVRDLVAGSSRASGTVASGRPGGR